jgi:hypothetical protein
MLIFSSERKLHEDYDRKGSVEKKIVVVILKRLGQLQSLFYIGS